MNWFNPKLIHRADLLLDPHFVDFVNDETLIWVRSVGGLFVMPVLCGDANKHGFTNDTLFVSDGNFRAQRVRVSDAETPRSNLNREGLPPEGPR